MNHKRLAELCDADDREVEQAAARLGLRAARTIRRRNPLLYGPFTVTDRRGNVLAKRLPDPGDVYQFLANYAPREPVRATNVYPFPR